MHSVESFAAAVFCVSLLMLVYSREESECMSGFQTMCPKPMLITRALAGADF